MSPSAPSPSPPASHPRAACRRSARAEGSTGRRRGRRTRRATERALSCAPAKAGAQPSAATGLLLSQEHNPGRGARVSLRSLPGVDDGLDILRPDVADMLEADHALAVDDIAFGNAR